MMGRISKGYFGRGLLSNTNSAMASYDAGKKKNSPTNFDLDFMKETKYGSDPLSFLDKAESYRKKY